MIHLSFLLVINICILFKGNELSTCNRLIQIAYELQLYHLFQPCVIQIGDVFETAEVLYIFLELYESNFF